MITRHIYNVPVTLAVPKFEIFGLNASSKYFLLSKLYGFGVWNLGISQSGYVVSYTLCHTLCKPGCALSMDER